MTALWAAAALLGALGGGMPGARGQDPPPQGPRGNADAVINVNSADFPEMANHIRHGQESGSPYPRELTVDRPGAKPRRSQTMQGIPRVVGLDRDEYPGAAFREGGSGSNILPSNRSENRRFGTYVKNQLRGVPDGATVEFRVHDGQPTRNASSGAGRRGGSRRRATTATARSELPQGVQPAEGASEPTVLPASEGTNHAGEAGWSPEALSRMENNHFFRARRVDGRIQLNPITDPTAIDTQARPGEMIVQVDKASGRMTVTSQGSGIRPNERAGFLNRLGTYDPQTGQFSQPGAKAPAVNASARPAPVAPENALDHVRRDPDGALVLDEPPAPAGRGSANSPRRATRQEAPAAASPGATTENPVAPVGPEGPAVQSGGGAATGSANTNAGEGTGAGAAASEPAPTVSEAGGGTAAAGESTASHVGGAVVNGAADFLGRVANGESTGSAGGHAAVDTAATVGLSRLGAPVPVVDFGVRVLNGEAPGSAARNSAIDTAGTFVATQYVGPAVAPLWPLAPLVVIESVVLSADDQMREAQRRWDDPNSPVHDGLSPPRPIPAHPDYPTSVSPPGGPIVRIVDSQGQTIAEGPSGLADPPIVVDGHGRPYHLPGTGQGASPPCPPQQAGGGQQGMDDACPQNQGGNDADSTTMGADDDGDDDDQDGTAMSGDQTIVDRDGGYDDGDDGDDDDGSDDDDDDCPPMGGNQQGIVALGGGDDDGGAMAAGDNQDDDDDDDDDNDDCPEGGAMGADDCPD